MPYMHFLRGWSILLSCNSNCTKHLAAGHCGTFKKCTKRKHTTTTVKSQGRCRPNFYCCCAARRAALRRRRSVWRRRRYHSIQSTRKHSWAQTRCARSRWEWSNWGGVTTQRWNEWDDHATDASTRAHRRVFPWRRASNVLDSFVLFGIRTRKWIATSA